MNKQIKYGIVHIHSENSLKDSALKMPTLVQRAAELGAPAIVLTDHGTLTGVEEFKTAVAKYNKAHDTNIKCIPGVEAYVEEDDADVSHRSHLLLIPKDRQGFKAISKAVTHSNHRLDSQNIPRMNKYILNRYFGEGSEGYGHVIATSACMQGVLASILYQNNYIDRSIEKLRKKQSKSSSPNDEDYLSKKKAMHDIESEIASYTTRINDLTPISKKPYTKKEKTLKKFEGTPDYEVLKEALEREKAETASAKVEIEKLKKLRDKQKTLLKPIKEECKAKEGLHERWYEIEHQISELQSSLLSDESLYQEAKEATQEYIELFGKGNFYIEVQYHRIDAEAYLMPLLVQIADEFNLPLVAANDAHMAGNTEDEVKARQIMRSLRFNKWEEMYDSDKELYIKTDKELSAILSEILPTDVVERAMEGIKSIVDACNIQFPENESHYPVFDAPEGAPARLRSLCVKGIEWRYPGKKGWTKVHEERMEYELGIIEKLGYCDYLCICEDFLRYGRLLGKMDMKHPDPRYIADPYNIELLSEITQDNVGLGIGPGRGSGVGSLVNYLIGITGIDPIAHNLYFERFLNVERVSPPDIDSDIASEIRDKVIDYIKHKYGEEAVCCIMTKTKLQAKAAIRACARLLGSERFDNSTYYLDLGDEICKSLPEELNIKLENCVPDLENKYGEDEAAMTIINNALLIENTFTNAGMHAAGVIIADNGDVREYVPLCYIPGKQQFATQCEKGPAEALGLLKMDALGLKNLDVITHALRLIQQRHGVNIDIERVPFEKEVFENIFANGNTDAVFQFESPGMKKLLRRFKPSSIQHLTLLNAMYRPGPIQFIDGVIDVKSGKTVPHYIIPEMKEVLGETYSFPVFQEQVMSLFNKCAGFSLGEADIIRRAMAKKHLDELVVYKDKFVKGILAKGGNLDEIEEFWQKLLKFAEYAFNQSHSCAYSYVAYYTAWLKHHYPKEYMCAVLNATSLDKLPQMMKNCKTAGIEILSPDINYSKSEFSINDKGLLYGLNIIKSVSNQAQDYIDEREENGRFLSLGDFIMRTRAKKSDIDAFINAGAFDTFSLNRAALLDAREQYTDVLDKIKTQEQALEKATEEDKISRISAKIHSLINQYNGITINETIVEDAKVRLSREKELLGSFISSNPLDSYELPSTDSAIPICDLTEQGFVHIYGVISDLRVVKRKKDGKEMAFFTLEDKTGSVPVSCFTRQFNYYAEVLKEDAAVEIKGTCNVKTNTDATGEESQMVEIILDSAFALQKRKNNIVLYVNSVMDWTDNIRPAIVSFIDSDGFPLIIFDKLTGLYRKTKLSVNKDILDNSLGIKTSII